MGALNVDVSELNRLAADISQAGRRTGAAAAAVVRKSAHDIEAEAKAFAPVDTGNLRNSISTTITGDGRSAAIEAEIGPTASYGAFVEYGTSRHGPAAYMGPAFDRAQPGFISAIEQLMGDVL